MADSAPPILTNITSTYLECTVHCAKFHCLLRLRSNRGGGSLVNNGNQNASSAKLPAKNNTTDNNAAMMAIPDISRLIAVPILANRINALHKTEEEVAIPLLPTLFNVTRTDISNANIDDKINDNESILFKSNHPSRELIRITHDLEMQLKERLKDASDGAVTTQHTNGEEEQQKLNHTPAGIQEEFLLRSEAIILELLSAVQQQIRKEKYSGGGSGRNNRKRKASGQTSTSNNVHTSTTSNVPPLKYYSSLIRQLNVLQSMHNVTEISLHKDTTASSSSADDDTTTPSELTSVSVTCLDENKRSHTWHAELYPSIVLTMDMPAEFVLEDKNIRLEKWWEEDMVGGGGAAVDTISRNNNNAQAVAKGALPRIQHHFEQALQKYQLLFNELDDLDSHLWILEPSLPARRTSVERRIALWVSLDACMHMYACMHMFVSILGNLHYSIRSNINSACVKS